MLGELSSRLGLAGVALTLEGGYDLAALRASASATVRGILDGRRAASGQPMTAFYTRGRSSPEGTVAMARGAAIKKDDPARSASLEAAIEHFVVISGLSGAGKSQASKLFEDLGYSCVDNLPPALLDDFLALRRTDPDRYRRTALVLDIRGGDPAPAIQRAAASLADDGARLQLIYLEASDSSLISRYSETRHRHPLQASRSSVQASIAEERGRLAGTRALADHVIDTSGLSIGQLKDRIFAVIPRLSATDDLRIDIVTFGFKYGIPLEADLVFDVRFLTNPYWDPKLKPLSGLDEPVRDFVLGQPAAKRFLELVAELLELTAPAYRAEGKEQLRVALGCTGGYHRSIALAEALAARLKKLPKASVDGLPPGARAMKGPRLPRWLYPGMHLKRWLVLLLAGIAILGLGAAIFIRDLYRQNAADEIAVVYWLTGAWLEPRDPRRAGGGARPDADRHRLLGPHALRDLAIRRARRQRHGGPLHEALPGARPPDRGARWRHRALDAAPWAEGLQRQHHGGGGRRR